MSETAQLCILVSFLFLFFFIRLLARLLRQTFRPASTLIAGETGGSVWEVLYQRSHVVVTPAPLSP